MTQLKAFFILSVLALAALPWACANNPMTPNDSSAAPTNTPALIFTATVTPTGTPTNTATKSPTSTPSSTATQSPTATPTNTASNSPTATPPDTSTDTPTPPGSPTFTDTPTVTPTCFMGAAPTISGDYDPSGIDVLLFPYQAPTSGNIYGMTGQLLVTGGSPFYQYGVYADDGAGNPTNLLGSTAIITPPGGAFEIQSQTFSSPIPITAGNTYWLAFFGNVALYYDYLSTAGQFKQINVAGGPTPMPSSPAPASITGLATGQPVFYLYASTCP